MSWAFKTIQLPSFWTGWAQGPGWWRQIDSTHAVVELPRCNWRRDHQTVSSRHLTPLKSPSRRVSFSVG